MENFNTNNEQKIITSEDVPQPPANRTELRVVDRPIDVNDIPGPLPDSRETYQIPQRPIGISDIPVGEPGNDQEAVSATFEQTELISEVPGALNLGAAAIGSTQEIPVVTVQDVPGYDPTNAPETSSANHNSSSQAGLATFRRF